MISEANLFNLLLRADGNKDDKLGPLSSSQCGLVELAAVLFYRVGYLKTPGFNIYVSNLNS